MSRLMDGAQRCHYCKGEHGQVIEDGRVVDLAIYDRKKDFSCCLHCEPLMSEQTKENTDGK